MFKIKIGNLQLRYSWNHTRDDEQFLRMLIFSSKSVDREAIRK